ncbi:unnamed protein product, partial [Heterosigma akashiwo]
GLFLAIFALVSRAFHVTTPISVSVPKKNAHCKMNAGRYDRRVALMASGGFLGGIFGSGKIGSAFGASNDAAGSKPFRPTNEVVKVVDGIRHKRLGGGDIIVSEVGLGTQRWVSEDFNSPSQEDCFKFMDTAILDSGVNLIDTA